MNRPMWRSKRSAALAAALLFLSVSLIAVTPGLAVEGRALKRDFAIGQHRDLELQLPFGDLTVEPGDGDAIRVELVMKCEHGWGDCDERMQRVDIEQRSQGDQLLLEVTGMSKRANLGLNIKMRAYVPKSLGLEVRMGAGDVRIDDVTQDLRVHLGAGDVDIHMAETDVRSVDLRAGVGDASLRRARGRVEAERSHFIGGAVHWSRGPGDAEVDVQVGAGDIEMRLD